MSRITNLMHIGVAAMQSAAMLAAQSPKRVFIITDAEGVAGICRQDQTDPKDVEMRQLLTGETNAAVEGFFAGGADEVIVWDGHDGSQTLSALTIHPRARIAWGNLDPTMTMERGYSAVAFIGQHARANVTGGVMAHSYSSLGIQTMLMNGKPVGEIETRTALAGHYGVPVIMLSGDKAAADDLRAIVPNAEFAVVKEGIGYYPCLSLSAKAAQELIRDKAQRAMRRLGEIKPYKLSDPVTLEVEYTTRNTPMPTRTLPPGAERVGARTIRFTGRDILEVWSRYRM